MKISSDDLIKSGGSDRIHFLDLELGGQGASPVADEIEKICLARLIQGGIDDYFLARDVEADILGLVKLLPERGALGVIGRSGFINLYDWIKTEPQKAALAASRVIGPLPWSCKNSCSAIGKSFRPKTACRNTREFPTS